MEAVDKDRVEMCRKAQISEDLCDDMEMLFNMFSDSTRLKIMNALFVNELCVGDIAELLEMSQSAVSHQLASLKKTKLVRTRKIGKRVYYSMADDHIKNIYKMAYEHITEND